ncbi:CidA/LrgA family protein [Brevibacillus dissolubilis]|uniref:CidA/LrgA family protein n=1 Tax=Brevibacillus dissolubilis TaxID=1844116 RepID=UPI00159BEAB5|nr:CidA/LrgA family protein [Brevibacillus dissolubilis]
MSEEKPTGKDGVTVSRGDWKTALRGWIILLICYGVGVLLQHAGVPLPGNLIGLMLLTLCLLRGWVTFAVMEQACQFLLRHMLFFFIPIIVGVAQYAGLLQEQAIPVTVAMLTGPPLIMLITGKIVQKAHDRIAARDTRDKTIKTSFEPKEEK